MAKPKGTSKIRHACEGRKRLASALEKAAAMNSYAKVDPAVRVQEQRDERALSWV